MQQPLEDDTDPLAPVPAGQNGALIGYARVSTKSQLLDRQIHALTEAGCERIYSDKKSGKNAEREELSKALDYLRAGDTLVVPSLDRLGRSIQGPHLHRGRTAQARHRLHLAARGSGHHHPRRPARLPRLRSLAEFIRELIVQGTNEGLDAARARGARLGRPAAMASEQIQHARDLLARPGNTVTSIAKLLGVSRNTIYKYVPELKGGRVALAEAEPLPVLPLPRNDRREDRTDQGEVTLKIIP